MAHDLVLLAPLFLTRMAPRRIPHEGDRLRPFYIYTGRRRDAADDRQRHLIQYSERAHAQLGSCGRSFIVFSCLSCRSGIMRLLGDDMIPIICVRGPGLWLLAPLFLCVTFVSAGLNWKTLSSLFRRDEDWYYASLYGLSFCISRCCECLLPVWSLILFNMADARCVLKLSSALLAPAKTVTILVGGNGTTQDPSLIFQPQEVKADVGDFVVFNCASSIVFPSLTPIFSA